VTKKKEMERSDDTAELQIDATLQQLNHALMVVEEEIGRDSIAAAEIHHRIGLELCNAEVFDAAERYCAHAFAIMRKNAAYMLLDMDCSDHLCGPGDYDAEEDGN
jgi:hypothetical protein